MQALMLDEHLSVDGTVTQAWAERAQVPSALAGGKPA